MSRAALTRLLVSVAVLAGPLVVFAESASASTPVQGGGSTFAAPELQQWSADVSHAPYNLTTTYAVSSSGAGRDDYAQGESQYGASDIVYYAQDGSFEQEAETKHPFKYVTVSAGGLAFMYNIVIGGQRWTGLQLTPKNVCQIFTGKVTNWSQLAGTPGDSVLAGVNEPIGAVVRSDAAGESYVLSQYCIAVDPTDWDAFANYVQSQATQEGAEGWAGDADLAADKPIENWPPVLADNGRDIFASGATQLIGDITDPNIGGYSIGYTATAYATDAGYPVAAVENGGGDFVQPTPNSVQLALSYAQANNLGTFTLDFTGTNPGAYFPSTYSYIIAPTTTNAPTSAGADATLAAWLCYSVGEGQNEAARISYAPLSAQVTALSVAAIEAIPGAPAASTCGIGGPAPDVASNGGGIVGNDGGALANKTTTGAVQSTTSTTTAAVDSSGGTSSGGTSGSSSGGSTSSGGRSATGSGSSQPTTATGAATAGKGLGSGGVGGSGGGATNDGTSLDASSPTSVALASDSTSKGTTNFQAYWYLIIGAIVCAVGVAAVGARNGTSSSKRPA